MGASSYRLFTPRYPYCIVEELPRRREHGSIVLTDDANKPLYEGIVIETWKPFEETRTEKRDGHKVEIVINRKSEFQPGDHVLFPHWAGNADPSNKAIHFISERMQDYNNGGCLIAKIEPKEPETIRNRFTNLLLKLGGKLYTEVADDLLKEFVIVPRYSVTGSGVSEEGI